MVVGLVHVMTHDGVRLDDTWRKPHAERTPQLGVDMVIFHDGVAGNFDIPGIFEGCNDAGLRF
jgi:hypothetical protein